MNKVILKILQLNAAGLYVEFQPAFDTDRICIVINRLGRTLDARKSVKLDLRISVMNETKLDFEESFIKLIEDAVDELSR